MKSLESYKNQDDLPITLSVEDVAKTLNISRAHAYNLVNSTEFPKIRIGRRLCVPKTAFLTWIEKHTSGALEAAL